MQEIIVIIVVIVILTIIIFILLKRLMKMISEDARIYYLAKLQVYDELIEEREKRINALKIEEEKIEKDEDDEAKIIIEKKDNVELANPYSQPNYEIENLNLILKEVENNFNYNNQEIIEIFLKNINQEVNKKYFELLYIKKKIESYGVFEIATENAEKQLAIMKKLKIDDTSFFKENEWEVFDINEFMKSLTLNINKEDPNVYVYVGNSNENYDEINPFIKTVLDEKILKGIRIKYKGHVFDYSLV